MSCGRRYLLILSSIVTLPIVFLGASELFPLDFKYSFPNTPLFKPRSVYYCIVQSCDLFLEADR